MGILNPLPVYFGHHRCGSTWIHAILDGVAANAGWHLAYLAHEESLALYGGDLDAYVDKERVDFLSFVNANIAFVRNLRPHRGFHVVRDPRDVLVSAYYSHRYRHRTENWPELVVHRKELDRLSKDEGLFLEMEFSRQYFEHMRSWDYDQENVLELRLEDVAADPYGHYLRIFEFLGLLDEDRFSRKRQLANWAKSSINILWHHRLMPARSAELRFPAERLLGVVHRHRFSRLAHGRARGQEDVQSHYRKGAAGDWVNHFNEEHVSRFKELYSDLVLKLDYESSPDWSSSPR